ncbi:hypothetical protein COUCH_35940 [Couchioplanes caeruleus]|uniref:hypothetical protein n=1 Tax=Couchioplanes caeruleus TaxID=56438 RepID=UPI0020C0B728|nr:hypothetical protein [Couchioplanes caeruleus]UQU64292.1 hypothetical protein COUCH_35940 [Couchioplanes caeruleus]
MARKSEQQMIDDSRRAGRELALAFQNGVTPQPIPVKLALQPGELCFGEIPMNVYQFLEGDGGYVKRSGGWMLGGGVFGAVYSAVNLTSNAVGNAARRAKAARDAAGQWRHVDTGTVYLTNRRWSMQTRTTWHDLWFADIRMSDCDGKMVDLEMAGMPRTGLVIPGPDYWYVMFNKLAYDQVVMPPPPLTGAA